MQVLRYANYLRLPRAITEMAEGEKHTLHGRLQDFVRKRKAKEVADPDHESREKAKSLKVQHLATGTWLSAVDNNMECSLDVSLEDSIPERVGWDVDWEEEVGVLSLGGLDRLGAGADRGTEDIVAEPSEASDSDTGRRRPRRCAASLAAFARGRGVGGGGGRGTLDSPAGSWVPWTTGEEGGRAVGPHPTYPPMVVLAALEVRN